MQARKENRDETEQTKMQMQIKRLQKLLIFDKY